MRRREDRRIVMCADLSAEIAVLFKILDNAVRGDLGGYFRRVEVEFGVLRRLVIAVDAGEVLDLAAARAGVEPLDVALFADFERGRDIDLDELAVLDDFVEIIARADYASSRNRRATIKSQRDLARRHSRATFARILL